MSWLRLDDGFTKHPKFEGWPPHHRWAWLEAMEYCARYNTRGRIPTDTSLLPRSVTATILKRAEAAGWCHREEDGALWINDWDEFNPPRQSEEELDELVIAAIGNHPEASANDLVRIVGGNRKAVLSSIRRVRQTSQVSQNGGSEVVPEVVPEIDGKVVPGTGSGTGTGTGSRAGARARPRPVPSSVDETSAVDAHREPARSAQQESEEHELPDLDTVLHDLSDWA